MRNSRRVSDAVLLCLTLSLAACTPMRQVGADDIVLQNTIRWATASESNNFGFDVYRGDAVGEGRRSLAFALRLQATDRTLTDGEVAELRQRCIDAVQGSLPATLRG